jgi:hypothetical protein
LVPAARLTAALADPTEQAEAFGKVGATNIRGTITADDGHTRAIDLYMEMPDGLLGLTLCATIHMRWDKDSHTCVWQREDHTYGKRVRGSGTLKVVAQGEHSCLLVEEGEIDIDFPVLGSRIAHKLAHELEQGAPERSRYWQNRLTTQALVSA